MKSILGKRNRQKNASRFVRFFPRKARRAALAALRGQAAGGAPHPTPAMPAALAAARHFRRAGAGCRGRLPTRGRARRIEWIIRYAIARRNIRKYFQISCEYFCL
ncbi:hypothetical protein [Burkholderia pseudomallei]|uniref:hypothetical protein n=1 Tax=Burkholderia pseudomallei TaxID=28450 RepID=UPI0012AD4E91|nr:hypothetical protein [Burkholderia pseudomallei]MBO3031712.1 hypothetical protein [Burkholderia pseudomallei]